MRSLADTAGLHLSLTEADLPSLQASVDTADLETITSMRNTNAAASLSHGFFLKIFFDCSSSFSVYAKIEA